MPRGIRSLLLALPATLALAGAARAQAPVSLTAADPFAVLGGTAVTSAGATVIDGDLGVSPGGAVTGFPPGVVDGMIHAADAVAAQAQLSLARAYADAAGRPVTATIPTQLGGTTLPPGVYDSNSGAFSIAGTLTLDGQGDGDAVFIFKTATTLTTVAGGSRISLIKSADSCNVFWQVGTSATLGANTLFRGNVLAADAIAAGGGATVDGRLLARSADVALEANAVTAAKCDERKPALKVSKVPRRCTNDDFRARFTVSDQSRVSTKVFLDGRRIRASAKRSFAVPIRASRLATGRHTIRAVSRDAAGNKRVKKARFERCPQEISFTG
jgi:hypothetical protein